MDFQKAFNEWAETSKVAFDDDRTATIGGSEIGGCARQVGYKKSSTPPDAGYVESQGFAARGNVMEDNVIVPVVRSAVEKLGGSLLWAGQAEQMRLVNTVRKVSVTPDGLAINMPFDCLASFGVKDITNGTAKTGEIYFEFKSIDPRVAAHKLPKDNHVDQVNLGMGMVRETEFEDGILYQPNYAVIVYVNASDYSEITVIVIAFDEEGYKGQLLRAKNIMNAAAEGPLVVETLRPEGKIAGGGDCKYCAFSKRCLGYAALVPRAVQIPDKKVVTSIRKMASALETIRDKADALGKKAKVMEADLKEKLIANKTKFLEVGDVKLDWNVSDGQERADVEGMKKRLAELGEDISKFVKRTKPSETLRISKVKKLAAEHGAH